MKKNKILIFDIETIPNFEAARKLLNMKDEKDDEKVLEELTNYHIKASATGNTFLRQPFHCVACISYVDAEILNVEGVKYYNVLNIKTAGSVESEEKEMIEGFSKFCHKNLPRLITFNGKIFDIPVLKYRAMKYQIPFGWFYNSEDTSPYRSKNSYDNRYNEDNLDLLESFAGWRGGVKMAEICSAFDIPCKYETDGSEVYNLYKKGRIEEIRNYCESDVLITYLLYVIYEQHCGNLTNEGFRKSILSLFTNIQESQKPHLIEFYNLCKNTEIIGKIIV